jgi:hypothetical protein
LKFTKTPHIRHYAGLKLCPLSSNGSGEFFKNYFYWEFNLKPSPFGQIYRILIIWDFKFVAPKVYILDKKLHNIGENRIIPHLYCREKIQLCLFYPRYKEFNELMSLCDTIIPWTRLWLQYYEEWLYSDDWKGGDAPHPINSNVEREDEIIQEISSSSQKIYVKKSVEDKIYAKRKNIFDLN